MGTNVKKIIESYEPKRQLSTASTPRSSWYTDPGILELERLTVFSRAWQFAGRADQVREAGQYITHEVAGEPILVIRGNDNVLRGFFNVCRHHAAAVATKCEGKAENLRCPYHGWTYDLEGKLILTPEFAGVANFDRSANGLVPVQTAEWHGWVFVKLDGGGPTLEEFLSADLIERIEPLHLERLKWFERRSYSLNCNWKVFVDNYLDGGYHVPHIHGGLASVLDYSQYTIETGEHFCLQSSPIASGKTKSPNAAVRQGERANYFWLYPNFMINVYDEVMDTNLVIPHGVDKTEVIFDYYFADVSQSAREKNLASIAVSEQIQSEDVAICESVQRGLNSRVYNTGRLSVRREAGEHLFHKLLYANLSAVVT
ncbi:MAG: aromatic ring-hydroxylating dioxygenase subunit alpha [Deltaproteobacteria bacterium]|nr:aromatic ring-hydroxylating dioxygenase subunit alpha [Deltaproteobacteria bacterium]